MGLSKGAGFAGLLAAVLLLFAMLLMGSVSGIGVNWGTQLTHPLPAATVVKMLKDNGFQTLKLFDADSSILSALKNSQIQVMVGIPNDMLYTLSNSVQAAEKWVAKNVSAYVSSNGVDIRYVAVGNEPFLETYNGTFEGITLPALQNIQAALVKAGLSSQIKVTVPMNGDVYKSSTDVPSQGDFRANIQDRMVEIVKFLNDNGSPFTVNIYPFISLYDNPNFPVDYAFFNGYSSPIDDNGKIYQDMFTANYDTLVWTLQKYGYGNMSIIVGEIGWPTDGDQYATLQYAQRFNQGFMARYIAGQGTPMRSGPLDAYLFSLIDEDAKSIQPGNFERHWGIFYFDGTPKYQLNLTANSNGLVPASNVKYLSRQWCVMSPSASLDDPQLAPSVSYACANGDCTSLGYGTSCGNLDARGNISYAFNSYYQIQDQLPSACKFGNLSGVTNSDPSSGDCQFHIMIKTAARLTTSRGGSLRQPVGLLMFLFMLFCTIL